jgi:hypothetical protein
MADMTPKEYKQWHKQQQPRQSSTPAWATFGVAVCLLLIIGTAVLVDHYPKSDSASKTDATAFLANVGAQATHVPRTDPIATAVPRNGSLSDTDYNATAQAEYDRLAKGGTSPTPASAIATPDLGKLPVNSAGNPVIDARQQRQLDASANLALLEREQARLTAQAIDVASRAPDVSKADAEQMMHRDLCHVPRADPHTCDQGLFKPTPVQ